MNPDYAIVLNFKLSDQDEPDFDFLVKTARNIGVRAVSGDERLKNACEKYTIFYTKEDSGQDLTDDNVISSMLENRKNGRRTVINIPIQNGNFSEDAQRMLDTINSWMHMYGHAFNDGTPSDLTINQDGFVLKNRHAAYQQYVFLKTPLPKEIIVSGLKQEPNRVEWIQNRVDLAFNFNDEQLEIVLSEPEKDFPWHVLRIQEHRPEDDLAETKY